MNITSFHVINKWTTFHRLHPTPGSPKSHATNFKKVLHVQGLNFPPHYVLRLWALQKLVLVIWWSVWENAFKLSRGDGSFIANPCIPRMTSTIFLHCKVQGRNELSLPEFSLAKFIYHLSRFFLFKWSWSRSLLIFFLQDILCSYLHPFFPFL